MKDKYITSLDDAIKFGEDMINADLEAQRQKNNGLTDEEMYQEVMSNWEDPIYNYTHR